MELNDNTSPTNGHHWRFFRAGGFDQVRLEDVADLAALENLDQKLWVALACPVKGLEFDERTLALIDQDNDGRIRPPELLNIIRWTLSLLKDPSGLSKRSPFLPLAAINDTTEDGSRILFSARQVLADLGKPEADSISVEDLADTAKIFNQTLFNGDGVIPPAAAKDEEVRAVIVDIIDCLGADLDRSGLPGVSLPLVEQFFTEAKALAAWGDKGEFEAGKILPLGEETPLGAKALAAVVAKVGDYFLRCRLAAFDPCAAAPLNPDPATYAAMAAEELGADSAIVAGLPLALAEAGRPLPLQSGINPAWSVAINHFVDTVVVPLLGARESLSEADWQQILARLAPFTAWEQEKPSSAVERLGMARIHLILQGEAYAAILGLIAQDQELEPQATTVATVEKLVRMHRDLFTLCNNFISFRDFYSRIGKAIFQAGTLYLDGRSCELCLRVEDTASHSAVATAGRIFLTYCDCTRQGLTAKMTIAAAFTAGDSVFLQPGRNGVFYDRQGRDWDATIVKIVEHPISLQQAFLSPYRQIGKLVGEQIQKFMAAKEKVVIAQASTGLTDAEKKAAVTKEGSLPPAFDMGKFAGIFAAIGLAMGAIASALAAVVTGFFGLSWWQMPLALIGGLAMVSGPSMLIAWFKLRERNLGPLLDACGWALNTRAKINIPFGASLTSLAKLPVGAERALYDPFAEKRRPWRLYLAGLLIILILGGGLVLWWKGLLTGVAFLK